MRCIIVLVFGGEFQRCMANMQDSISRAKEVIQKGKIKHIQ